MRDLPVHTVWLWPRLKSFQHFFFFFFLPFHDCCRCTCWGREMPLSAEKELFGTAHRQHDSGPAGPGAAGTGSQVPKSRMGGLRRCTFSPHSGVSCHKFSTFTSFQVYRRQCFNGHTLSSLFTCSQECCSSPRAVPHANRKSTPPPTRQLETSLLKKQRSAPPKSAIHSPGK